MLNKQNGGRALEIFYLKNHAGQLGLMCVNNAAKLLFVNKL